MPLLLELSGIFTSSLSLLFLSLFGRYLFCTAGCESSEIALLYVVRLACA
jgi:hypothetical protein